MKDRKKPALGLGRMIALIITLALFTASCSGNGGSLPDSPMPVQTDTPEATGEDKKVILGEAQVDSIEILILESFPVQINVVTKGNLPDGCTEIDEVVESRSGNEFTVKIATVRPADAICTQALVPFEERVSLDVYGLKAGTYTVEVNGVTDTFVLDIDNVPHG